MREKGFEAKRIIDSERETQVDLVTVEFDDVQRVDGRLAHMFAGIFPSMRDLRRAGRLRRCIKVPGCKTPHMRRQRSLT